MNLAGTDKIFGIRYLKFATQINIIAVFDSTLPTQTKSIPSKLIRNSDQRPPKY